MFNTVLAMENAAVKRLEYRINEVSLLDAKQQFQHHLEETKEQQNDCKISVQNITEYLQEKNQAYRCHPIQNLKKEMESSMTEGEKELKNRGRSLG